MEAEMRYVVAYVIGLVGLGCAAEAQDVQAACAPRKGSYVVQMIEKSGTCGPLNDQIVQIDGTEKPPPNCTSTWANTADNCKSSGSETCTTSTGARITEKGTCTFEKDGSAGTCEVQIVIVLASGDSCSGIYEERIRRQ
jgi:hypothetical protein